MHDRGIRGHPVRVFPSWERSRRLCVHSVRYARMSRVKALVVPRHAMTRQRNRTENAGKFSMASVCRTTGQLNCPAREAAIAEVNPQIASKPNQSLHPAARCSTKTNRVIVVISRQRDIIRAGSYRLLSFVRTMAAFMVAVATQLNTGTLDRLGRLRKSAWVARALGPALWASCVDAGMAGMQGIRYSFGFFSRMHYLRVSQAQEGTRHRIKSDWLHLCAQAFRCPCYKARWTPLSRQVWKTTVRLESDALLNYCDSNNRSTPLRYRSLGVTVGVDFQNERVGEHR